MNNIETCKDSFEFLASAVCGLIGNEGRKEFVLGRNVDPLSAARVILIETLRRIADDLHKDDNLAVEMTKKKVKVRRKR